MDELLARPCEVEGRPALFHRWVEEDEVLLQFNVFSTDHDRKMMIREFWDTKVTPAGVHTETVRHTLALVEYRDGTIAKVKPELIRFIRKEAPRE
jgi:hypothetical protein